MVEITGVDGAREGEEGAESVRNGGRKIQEYFGQLIQLFL